MSSDARILLRFYKLVNKVLMQSESYYGRNFGSKMAFLNLNYITFKYITPSNHIYEEDGAYLHYIMTSMQCCFHIHKLPFTNIHPTE